MEEVFRSLTSVKVSCKKKQQKKHHSPASEGPVFRQMVPPACSFISMVGRAMHRGRRPCSASGPRHSVYPSCPAKEPICGGSGFLHSYLSVPPGSTMWFLPAQLSCLRLVWLVSGWTKWSYSLKYDLAQIGGEAQDQQYRCTHLNAGYAHYGAHIFMLELS